jgi:predicted phage terminase large subunit-like protein
VIKAAAARGGDEWKVIEFPAILDSGNPLWPEFWSLKELEVLREELPNSKWQAQYMQQPTSDSSAIIKREWWKVWEHEDPPRCDFIIQSWDTAHEKKTVNDYSACTTWGVWFNEEDNMNPNVILLDAYKERLEFPQLKKKAYEMYQEFEPDTCLIEKKAAGAPLIQELRWMGLSVSEYSPGKGQDKISRLNSVADLFASGKVWAPETRWAEELVDEVASFPSGEHDDLVDSMTLALMRFRQGGFLRLPTDEPDEIKYFKSKRNPGYYNV